MKIVMERQAELGRPRRLFEKIWETEDAEELRQNSIAQCGFQFFFVSEKISNFVNNKNFDMNRHDASDAAGDGGGADKSGRPKVSTTPCG
jgi:hypothetical protein